MIELTSIAIALGVSQSFHFKHHRYALLDTRNRGAKEAKAYNMINLRH